MKQYTVKEYAEKKGLSISYVYYQINTGKLPEGVSCVKIGKNTHILQEQVKETV